MSNHADQHHAEAHHEETSDDWFPEFAVDNLGGIALGALVIASMIAGGMAIGLVVLAFILGLSFGGRPGLGLIGAAVGFMLGGLPGAGIGMGIGVFNAWIYEIESHRRGGNVVKQLGWINGLMIGGLMAGQAGTSGVQWILAIAIYAFIGGFAAEVVPGFLRFLASLDEDAEEETV